MKDMYEYLLQRLQYLSKDADFEFSDSFIVGDQTTQSNTILKKQAYVQAGLGKFSDLPVIVNKSWFGSSVHDPCLQIADWVAYTVRNWAENNRTSQMEQIMPNFRGYPDIDKVLGKGIVCCPDKDCFPKLINGN
jgi:hypothetical protein